jgi:DNA-binding XRE family transcriptional regulator
MNEENDMPRTQKNETVELQFITSPSGDELVVMPRAAYDRLIAENIAAADDLLDEHHAAKIIDRLKGGKEGTLPHNVVMRMRKENRIKVLREHRGLTQRELAEKAELSTLYISQLETGAAGGGRKGLQKIAEALGVEAAMITTPQSASIDPSEHYSVDF